MRNEVGSSEELQLRRNFLKTDTLLPQLEPTTPNGDRPLWERLYVAICSNMFQILPE